MGLFRPRPAPPLQSVDPIQIARRSIPQQSHKLLFRTTHLRILHGPAHDQPLGATSDRICADGSIIQRNTLRKDNAFFSWDTRLSRPIPLGNGHLEAIVEVFNLLNTDNYRAPSSAGLLFNFDGTVQSGLGDPREVQIGMRYVF